MASSPYRIFLVCGEPSGDLHGGELVERVGKLVPIEVVAAGGPRLAEAGAEVRWQSTGWGTIGPVEALVRLPRYMRLMKTLVRQIRELSPDLLVLVDFGAFNLRLARQVRKTAPGVKIFYYFPPSSWDRRPRDFSFLLRVTDYIATPFPWNAARLAAQGATVRWVGHPARDRIAPPEDKAQAKAALGLRPEAPVLGLLPGSRRKERRLLGPTFLQAAELLRARISGLQVLWSSPAGSAKVDDALGPVQTQEHVIVTSATAGLLQAADAALCSFGTVTLEAALADCPIVGAYRFDRVNAAFGRYVMRVKLDWYTLPNIMAGEGAVVELKQEEVTPGALADAAYELLAPQLGQGEGERLKLIRRAYALVRQRVGPPGASDRAAQMVAEVLEGKLLPHRRPLG
ncbi:MAG: lipid-A-disaccharide synthase [Armatimonadetes bacterium]|nr:lipid-A-disaccharide synthase [Armatimonadota bacterium]